MKRLAICVGLTRVDPDAYYGWDGDCPGADADIHRLALMCHGAGFDGVSVLFNESARPAYLLPVFEEACVVLEGGDLFSLFFSGHGGSWRDLDGDEEDGRDETLALWDGELVDDKIAEYLQMVPAGVRIWMFTDSCHSATVHRGVERRRTRAKQSRPIKLRERSVQGMRASLLHFAGCADDRYSYGVPSGGWFTSAFLRTLQRARKPLTYREVFDRACKAIPKPHKQEPILTEWLGPGQKSFAEREVLS
jgi:hypothetical protein